MDGTTLSALRRSVGLTQTELARRAGTSREMISAYERARQSPDQAALSRLLEALDPHPLSESRPDFVHHHGPQGRTFVVPTRLPRLPLGEALRVITLPFHLAWSGTPRSYDLADRRQRALVYEIVLREGAEEDILSFIDGPLLADLWDSLVLPDEVRSGWQKTMGVAARVA